MNKDKIFNVRVIFGLGLILRLIFVFQGEGHFIEDLFLPFLDKSVLNWGQNPWALSPPHFFPYGSSLYLLLALPRALIYGIGGSSALAIKWLGHLSIKLPLLMLDIFFCALLQRLFPVRKLWILLFYWVNPVLIYISYVHGQLDLVAIFLLTLSAFLIQRERIFLSGLAFAASLSAKFHVAVVLPIFLVFLWNRNFRREALQKIALWGSVFGAVTLLAFLPLAFAGRVLYASTSNPESMRLFAARADLGSGVSLLLGTLMVLTVLGRILISTRISRTALFWAVGIVLGTLLLVVNPAEGWYFWVLPFICVFVAVQTNFPRLVFYLFLVAYFFHFLALPALLQNLGIEDPHYIFRGLSLTVLQALVLAHLLGIWHLTLAKDIPLENRTKPFLVGLSGDSGAGKNRFSELLQKVYGLRQTVVVHGDDYHKWERGHGQWEKFTHLDPQANSLLELSRNVRSLERGFPVLKSHYDHNIGKFTDPVEIQSSKTVIVQGLHSLYPRDLRKMFDIRIFLKPHPLVRLAWKLSRDQRERGHSQEKILASLRAREKDSALHIEPQEKYADWIISHTPAGDVSEADVLSGKEFGFKVVCTLWNEAPILDLAEELAKVPSIRAELKLIDSNIDRLNFEFEGRIAHEEVATIASRIFPDLRQITRGRCAPAWQPDYDGILQLLYLALVKKRDQGLGSEA